MKCGLREGCTRGVVLLEHVLELLELGDGELLELSASALESAVQTSLSCGGCHLVRRVGLKKKRAKGLGYGQMTGMGVPVDHRSDDSLTIEVEEDR